MKKIEPTSSLATVFGYHLNRFITAIGLIGIIYHVIICLVRKSEIKGWDKTFYDGELIFNINRFNS